MTYIIIYKVIQKLSRGRYVEVLNHKGTKNTREHEVYFVHLSVLCAFCGLKKY
jgi:hypothetical protein